MAFNIEQNTWQVLSPLAKGTMDHRGLLARHNGALYRIGGMNNQQRYKRCNRL
ncbi:hypothetical protein ACOBV9_18115 (plasmid) [Pseudoalteromonas espejiana]